MAEGFARLLFGRLVRVQSATSKPGEIDPLAVAAMHEIGIAISSERSASLDEIDPASVDATILLEVEGPHPPWSGKAARLRWPIRDPATVEPGISAETLQARFCAARDQLRSWLWASAGTILADGLSIGAAERADLAAIEALVRDGGLPEAVVRDQFPDAYAVARRDGAVVGVAALESHGNTSLLRSVAIAPAERGRGTGIALVCNRLSEARAQGVDSVYLLTTTAAAWFRRFGFLDADRAAVPDALQASPELAALCPSSAACMRLSPGERAFPRMLASSNPRAVEIRAAIRDRYARVARGPAPSAAARAERSRLLGYRADDLRAVPDGTDLGLGCGDPVALASLRPGETVLDLGAGSGLDCLLASRAVGPSGRVIGVEMTREMIARAIDYTRRAAVTNVEFWLGEIERLPAPDRSIDAILSNGAIHLSPEKWQVFREAFRVLRDLGRLAICDIVAIAPIPAELPTASSALAGGIAGAAHIDEVRGMLADAGFREIRVTIAPRSAEIVNAWMPGADPFLAAVTIEARRGTPSIPVD